MSEIPNMRPENGETREMHKESAAPAVGIIFMRGNDLRIDSTPVTDAVNYGLLKTHEKGHPDYWEELQRSGSVPRDEEYDEVARGRVTYDQRKKTFYLFLDRCISERPAMVSKIFEKLHLPPHPATEINSDSHYICPGCRPKDRHEEGEDEDW